MLLLENNKLKRYILENLRQEEIVAVFLGVSEEEVNYCLAHPSNKIRNPLRTDKRPSLGMMWQTDNSTGLPKIKLYDFAESMYRGDCFDLVSWTSTLNPANKQHFVMICRAIIQYGSKQLLRIMPDVKQNIVITKQPVTISIQSREFNNYDMRYWSKFGITKEHLILDRCFAVEYAWINSNIPNYTYGTKDPCYAYYIGRDILNGNELYQLYFPLRKKDRVSKPRFITNSSYALLDITDFFKRDILVLVKSKKDKLTILSLLERLKSNTSFLLWGVTLDIRAISSENPTITKQQNDILQRNYPNIFIYTDFDRAGRQTAYYYKKAFGYHSLYITNGKFGTIDYGVKDISEYRDKFGEDKALALLMKAIEYIKDTVDQHDDIILTTLNN